MVHGPVNTRCTIPGGTTGVLGVMVMPYHSEHRWSRVGVVYASDIWRLEDAAMGYLAGGFVGRQPVTQVAY